MPLAYKSYAYKLGILLLLAIVALSLASIVNPMPRGRQELTPAQKAQKATEERQQEEEFARHEARQKAEEMKWHKIKLAQAKKFHREEDGHMVPSNTDLTDDWFEKTHDGQAGIDAVKTQKDPGLYGTDTSR